MSCSSVYLRKFCRLSCHVTDFSGAVGTLIVVASARLFNLVSGVLKLLTFNIKFFSAQLVSTERLSAFYRFSFVPLLT